MRAVFLTYDIPQKSKLPNPSNFLRRLGVRSNLSVWIIPEHLVPWDFLQNLKDGGATVHTVRFDESEADKLRKMASDALRRESDRVRKSMTDSLERARSILTASEVEESDLFSETDSREVKYDRYCKGLFRRARREIQAAEEAAVAFDLLGDVAEALRVTHLAIAGAIDAFVIQVNSRIGGVEVNGQAKPEPVHA